MTKSAIEHEIKNLQELLKMEKQEDAIQFQNKMSGTSYKQRRKLGVCWYPVVIEKSQYDVGERLLVKVSRSKEHIQSDSFQSGKLVKLFSNGKNNVEEDDFVNGVVNQVKESEMYLTLNCDELPHWIHDGMLGVQLLFDENSYREMENTLDYLLKTENPRINYLKSILFNQQKAQFIEGISGENPFLNIKQNHALNLVKSALDVAIIHGPPGTGKTTTLVQCILETLKKENQILVCAPSNAAIDLIIEKLNQKGISAVRIGHPARVTEEALSFTLDARLAHHSDYKTLRVLKKQAEEFYVMGGKWKRNFGSAEREQRKLLLMEARKLKQEAERLSDYIIDDILEKCQVIACTLVGANNSKLRGKRFKTLFIDEAAQALEPACWIPIVKAERVIFAGDHQQLPPTIRSYKAAKAGLENTLFEKVIQKQKVDVMLNEQYRMNEKIMGFSSEHFYNNELIANEQVKHWQLFPSDLPLEFVDTAGCAYMEQVDAESKSTFNPEEAAFLFKHLSAYLEQIQEENALENLQNIAIITPYRAQLAYLKELLDSSELDLTVKQKININTIDSFQGQEKDVIYISLVRSNDKGEIGFLADERRMNVALTRARKKLVIIGDSATVARNPFYHKLVDYATNLNSYRSAFEWLY